MKLAQLCEAINTTFYHGSMEKLPVGTILKPQDDYEQNWGNTDFYRILEDNRPSNMLSHKKSVFLVTDADDVDLAGGSTEYLFTVKPLGLVERHDLNWSTEISMLISDGYKKDSDEIKTAASNYWKGIPHNNESVWEYLTSRAEILTVEEY